jgi:hypothetical protein
MNTYFLCGVSDYKNNRIDNDLLYNSKEQIALPYTNGRHYASWLTSIGIFDGRVTDELVNRATNLKVFIP